LKSSRIEISERRFLSGKQAGRGSIEQSGIEVKGIPPLFHFGG